MNAIFGMLAASPPAAGVVRVLLPGEVEMQAETRNRQHGICLAGEVADELVSLGNELGVGFARAVNPTFSPARQAQTI